MTSRQFRGRLSRRAGLVDLLLPEPIVDQLEAYYRLLMRWNGKINLTALPLEGLADRVVDRLLIEPLAAARLLPDSPVIWFDLGSGGGSPAVPLKIARPGARLTMVESKNRKAAFLREVVRTLVLTTTDVENARFEDVASRAIGAAEFVTVRAIKVDETLLGAARTLLEKGGKLLLFRPESSTIPIASGFEDVQTVRLAQMAAPSQIVVWQRRSDVPRGTSVRAQMR